MLDACDFSEIVCPSELASDVPPSTAPTSAETSLSSTTTSISDAPVIISVPETQITHLTPAPVDDPDVLADLKSSLVESSSKQSGDPTYNLRNKAPHSDEKVTSKSVTARHFPSDESILKFKPTNVDLKKCRQLLEGRISKILPKVLLSEFSASDNKKLENYSSLEPCTNSGGINENEINCVNSRNKDKNLNNPHFRLVSSTRVPKRHYGSIRYVDLTSEEIQKPHRNMAQSYSSTDETTTVNRYVASTFHGTNTGSIVNETITCSDEAGASIGSVDDPSESDVDPLFISCDMSPDQPDPLGDLCEMDPIQEGSISPASREMVNANLLIYRNVKRRKKTAVHMEDPLKDVEHSVEIEDCLDSSKMLGQSSANYLKFVSTIDSMSSLEDLTLTATAQNKLIHSKLKTKKLQANPSSRKMKANNVKIKKSSKTNSFPSDIQIQNNMVQSNLNLTNKLNCNKAESYNIAMPTSSGGKLTSNLEDLPINSFSLQTLSFDSPFTDSIPTVSIPDSGEGLLASSDPLSGCSSSIINFEGAPVRAINLVEMEGLDFSNINGLNLSEMSAIDLTGMDGFDLTNIDAGSVLSSIQASGSINLLPTVSVSGLKQCANHNIPKDIFTTCTTTDIIGSDSSCTSSVVQSLNNQCIQSFEVVDSNSIPLLSLSETDGAAGINGAFPLLDLLESGTDFEGVSSVHLPSSEDHSAAILHTPTSLQSTASVVYTASAPFMTTSSLIDVDITSNRSNSPKIDASNLRYPLLNCIPATKKRRRIKHKLGNNNKIQTIPSINSKNTENVDQIEPVLSLSVPNSLDNSIETSYVITSVSPSSTSTRVTDSINSSSKDYQPKIKEHRQIAMKHTKQVHPTKKKINRAKNPTLSDNCIMLVPGTILRNLPDAIMNQYGINNAGVTNNGLVTDSNILNEKRFDMHRMKQPTVPNILKNASKNKSVTETRYTETIESVIEASKSAGKALELSKSPGKVRQKCRRKQVLTTKSDEILFNYTAESEISLGKSKQKTNRSVNKAKIFHDSKSNKMRNLPVSKGAKIQSPSNIVLPLLKVKLEPASTDISTSSGANVLHCTATGENTLGASIQSIPTSLNSLTKMSPNAKLNQTLEKLHVSNDSKLQSSYNTNTVLPLLKVKLEIGSIDTQASPNANVLNCVSTPQQPYKPPNNFELIKARLQKCDTTLFAQPAADSSISDKSCKVQTIQQQSETHAINSLINKLEHTSSSNFWKFENVLSKIDSPISVQKFSNANDGSPTPGVIVSTSDIENSPIIQDTVTSSMPIKISPSNPLLNEPVSSLVSVNATKSVIGGFDISCPTNSNNVNFKNAGYTVQDKTDDAMTIVPSFEVVDINSIPLLSLSETSGTDGIYNTFPLLELLESCTDLQEVLQNNDIEIDGSNKEILNKDENETNSCQKINDNKMNYSSKIAHTEFKNNTPEKNSSPPDNDASYLQHQLQWVVCNEKRTTEPKNKRQGSNKKSNFKISLEASLPSRKRTQSPSISINNKKHNIKQQASATLLSSDEKSDFNVPVKNLSGLITNHFNVQTIRDKVPTATVNIHNKQEVSKCCQKCMVNLVKLKFPMAVEELLKNKIVGQTISSLSLSQHGFNPSANFSFRNTPTAPNNVLTSNNSNDEHNLNVNDSSNLRLKRTRLLQCKSAVEPARRSGRLKPNSQPRRGHSSINSEHNSTTAGSTYEDCDTSDENYDNDENYDCDKDYDDETKKLCTSIKVDSDSSALKIKLCRKITWGHKPFNEKGNKGDEFYVKSSNKPEREKNDKSMKSIKKSRKCVIDSDSDGELSKIPIVEDKSMFKEIDERLKKLFRSESSCDHRKEKNIQGSSFTEAALNTETRPNNNCSKNEHQNVDINLTESAIAIDTNIDSVKNYIVGSSKLKTHNRKVEDCPETSDREITQPKEISTTSCKSIYVGTKDKEVETSSEIISNKLTIIDPEVNKVNTGNVLNSGKVPSQLTVIDQEVSKVCTGNSSVSRIVPSELTMIDQEVKYVGTENSSYSGKVTSEPTIIDQEVNKVNTENVLQSGKISSLAFKTKKNAQKIVENILTDSKQLGALLQGGSVINENSSDLTFGDIIDTAGHSSVSPCFRVPKIDCKPLRNNLSMKQEILSLSVTSELVDSGKSDANRNTNMCVLENSIEKSSGSAATLQTAHLPTSSKQDHNQKLPKPGTVDFKKELDSCIFDDDVMITEEKISLPRDLDFFSGEEDDEGSDNETTSSISCIIDKLSVGADSTKTKSNSTPIVTRAELLACVTALNSNKTEEIYESNKELDLMDHMMIGKGLATLPKSNISIIAGGTILRSTNVIGVANNLEDSDCHPVEPGSHQSKELQSQVNDVHDSLQDKDDKIEKLPCNPKPLANISQPVLDDTHGMSKRQLLSVIKQECFDIVHKDTFATPASAMPSTSDVFSLNAQLRQMKQEKGVSVMSEGQQLSSDSKLTSPVMTTANNEETVTSLTWANSQLQDPIVDSVLHPSMGGNSQLQQHHLVSSSCIMPSIPMTSARSNITMTKIKPTIKMASIKQEILSGSKPHQLLQNALMGHPFNSLQPLCVNKSQIQTRDHTSTLAPTTTQTNIQILTETSALTAASAPVQTGPSTLFYQDAASALTAASTPVQTSPSTLFYQDAMQVKSEYLEDAEVSLVIM